MENKSKKTRNMIGIVLVILIGLVVWSIVNTQSKWKYEKLGLAEYGKGNYKEAIKYFTLGIESVPGNPCLYNNRGLAYYKLKDYKKAVLDYSKAIELKPDFAAAYFNRGLAYFKSARAPGAGDRDKIYNKAILDFTKAIELDPKHMVDAWYNRGLCLNQSVHYHKKPFTRQVEDTYRKALADFDKTLELDPDFALAFAGKGNAYYRHGDWDKADAEYAKAIKLKDEIAKRWGNKALAGVFASRGRNYLAMNELERAASDYDEALELDPKSTTSIGHGAAVYNMLKNYNKVVELNTRMIDLIENDPDFKDYARRIGRYYAGRAKAYYLLGHYNKAMADYQKALTSGGAEGHGYSYAEIHRYLGKIYLKTGRREEAETELRKAVRLYADKTGSKIKRVAAGGYTGRGFCWLDLEEYDRAISDFKRALSLYTPEDKGYAEAHKNLGLVYWKMGKSEKANEYFKKAIKLFEEGGRKYSAKELRDALRTGDVKGLLI